jgi:hypothetical protein
LHGNKYNIIIQKTLNHIYPFKKTELMSFGISPPSVNLFDLVCQAKRSVFAVVDSVGSSAEKSCSDERESFGL